LFSILSHNIGWGVHITKLLIIKFSPLFCYVVLLRPKYSQTPSSYIPPWGAWKFSAKDRFHSKSEL
jgi:hypothetical protein